MNLVTRVANLDEKRSRVSILFVLSGRVQVTCRARFERDVGRVGETV